MRSWLSGAAAMAFVGCRGSIMTGPIDGGIDGSPAQEDGAHSTDEPGATDGPGSDAPDTTDTAVEAYWVSPTGAASWASCKSLTPLDGAAACSLATANTNMAAGDLVTLRAGTYATGIAPAHSGNQGSRITCRGWAIRPRHPMTSAVS